MGNSSNYNVSQITKLQRRVCKIILGSEYSDLDSARRRLNILSFDQNVLVNKAKIMYTERKKKRRVEFFLLILTIFFGVYYSHTLLQIVL